MKKFGIILFAIMLAGMARAATVTWSGSDTNWTQPDTNSWNATYNSGDIAQFSGAGSAVNIDPGGVTPGGVSITSGSYTFSGGSISGTGTLTKAGSGTLTLTGSNTYSGTTTISAGVLDVGAMSSGALSTNSYITLDGGQLQGFGTFTRTIGGAGGSGWGFGGSTASGGFSARGGKLTVNTSGFSIFSSYANPFKLNSSTSDSELEWQSNITGGNNATRVITVNAGINANSFVTISGQLLSAGAGTIFQKAGTGKMVVKGNNNAYAGTWEIAAGVLNAQHNNAFGTTTRGASVTAGAALELQGNITIGAEALTLNGTGVSSDGALRNISGNNTYGGAITLNSAVRINSDADTLTLDVTSGDAITGAQNLTFGGAGNITVTDPIATGTGTVTKDGNGTLTLFGVNTYSGATTVTGGTLVALVGGSCSNSSVTVTNTPGMTSALVLLVTNNTMQWTCADLSFRTNGGVAKLEFIFDGKPSSTIAPLNVTNKLTCAEALVSVVIPSYVSAGVYPLVTVGGMAPKNEVPALSGVDGCLTWGAGEDKTLYLAIPGKGTVVAIR